jgi:hypothetical protein
MGEKDIQKLINLAEEKLASNFSQEDALRSLQRAGHLDNEGNFTPQYQLLKKAVEAATAEN